MAENKCVREIFYERERKFLSPYAFLTENTRGRDYPITECRNRTEFQRDRDRILHSKSFRRLMHKTQVFLFPTDEHYRNRLTHTLEVTQIARIISRALMLNEDLCEAAALGHDIGHTPFGHAGEIVMQECFSKDFTHYKQSVRVVEKLENNGAGLNLTWEVRDGIMNHTGDCMASTLEGIIVKFADRIAYINHDIDDSIRGGIITADDIPVQLRKVLGNTHSERINTMVSSVIENSTDRNEIRMAPEVEEAMMGLRQFLFDNVYHNPVAKRGEKQAMDLLRYLFEYFMKNTDKMPEFFRNRIEQETAERCVCDYICGMTDRYAIEKYKEIFIPQSWESPDRI